MICHECSERLPNTLGQHVCPECHSRVRVTQRDGARHEVWQAEVPQALKPRLYCVQSPYAIPCVRCRQVPGCISATYPSGAIMRTGKVCHACRETMRADASRPYAGSQVRGMSSMGAQSAIMRAGCGYCGDDHPLSDLREGRIGGVVRAKTREVVGFEVAGSRTPVHCVPETAYREVEQTRTFPRSRRAWLCPTCYARWSTLRQGEIVTRDGALVVAGDRAYLPERG